MAYNVKHFLIEISYMPFYNTSTHIMVVFIISTHLAVPSNDFLSRFYTQNTYYYLFCFYLSFSLRTHMFAFTPFRNGAALIGLAA